MSCPKDCGLAIKVVLLPSAFSMNKVKLQNSQG